jgi:16S rRNA (uracil1498-N3)-methyltransferase
VNLFYQPHIPEGVFHLNEDESRHCVKVLRKRNGDTISITDGRGNFYEAVITTISGRECHFEIVNTIAAPPRPCSIHIAISPTRNADRIEWFVEKSVELGIDIITLLDCDHTERSHIKIERLEKVAISAMKQSLKATTTTIRPLTTFSVIVNNPGTTATYIAHVDPSNPLHLKDIPMSTEPYLVLIGPEGDFSSNEIELATSRGFVKVGLGESRLRTETAGIAACHILNLKHS